MERPRAPEVGRPPAVLVLGNDSRMVLPVVRSLGRRGIEVHVGWCPADQPALRSRYVARVHRIPGPSLQVTDWLPTLQALHAEHRFTLTIPVTEAAVLPLQLHRERLEDVGEVTLIGERAFAVVSDKGRTHALAASLGVPVSETTTVSRDDDLDGVLDRLPLPAIVKPCATARTDAVAEKSFACRVEDRAQLCWYLEHLLRRDAEALVQEVAPGHGVGVELIAHTGDVLVALQHARLHETSGHGSTYRHTVPLDDELCRAAAALMKSLDYTGVAMVEFRVDPETGRWVFLEVNGRFWGSLPLAVAAGADFPGYLYRMWVHGERSLPRRYRVGVRSRNLTNDVRWTWRALRRKRPTFPPPDEDALGWAVGEVPRRRVLLDLLRALVLLDRSDTHARDDPGPARAELVGLARLAAQWLSGKLRRRDDDAPALPDATPPG